MGTAAQRLQSIKGIGWVTAAWTLVSTLNFTTCDTVGALTAYAGLAPMPRQSGTSVWHRPSIGLVVVFAAIFADTLALHNPEVSVKDARGRPVPSHLPPFWIQGRSHNTPLGTDFHSRDILSRLLYGAGVSLLVGMVGTLVAGALGTNPGHSRRLYRRVV